MAKLNYLFNSKTRHSVLACLLAVVFTVAVSAQEDQQSHRFVLREVVLNDYALIPAAVVKQYSEPLLQTPVASHQLIALTQSLTTYLVELGYVNSGVVMPDQQINDGILYLQVVPGKLTTVSVFGNNQLNANYVIDRIQLETAPFNINSAADQLRLLQLNPLIQTIDASVNPGLNRGEATLAIEIEETKAFTVEFSVDNYLSPNLGEQQQNLGLSHNNLSGRGDSLHLSLSHAEGLQRVYGNYQLPINRNDTTFSIFGEKSDADIVVEPFTSLDIGSDSQRLGIGLQHPLWNTLSSDLHLGFSVSQWQGTNYFFGEPISFGANDDGEVKASLFAFSQQWVMRNSSRVVAAFSQFNAGLDTMGATVGGEADSEFIVWNGQLQWREQLPWWNSSLLFKTYIQLGNDSLPAFQKLSLGGVNTVRGYRENAVIRDSGVSASLVWQLPLTRLSFPWVSTPGQGQITVYPFLDAGSGWDESDVIDNQTSIYSVGIGLDWQLSQKSYLSILYGYPLKQLNISQAEETLQDQGFHLRLAIGW